MIPALLGLVGVSIGIATADWWLITFGVAAMWWLVWRERGRAV